jgi:glycosyltransferase involved in cell wall biosynthesis
VATLTLGLIDPSCGYGSDKAASFPATPPESETRPVILIPAFLPDHRLTSLVAQLADSTGVAGVVIIDDGSGPGSEAIFAALAKFDRVRVLTHASNRGKGAALKTGLNYAARAFRDSAGVVTADADGQHAAKDVLLVAAALREHRGSLVLGARLFDTTAPFRSRFGNAATRAIMRVLTGQRLRDTQTGLRGIPMDLVPDLVRLRSTGYDFELDMLLACRDAAREIREVPISTIYIDGNKSSHFNPLLDSMRIYFVFVRFAAASMLTAAIDNGIFILGIHFWHHLAVCQAASRLVAGSFQFVAARRNVFRSDVRIMPALAKYWALSAASGILSFLLIQLFVRHTPAGIVPAKLAGETILFFMSFIVQRDAVFSRRPPRPLAAGKTPSLVPCQE